MGNYHLWTQLRSPLFKLVVHEKTTAMNYHDPFDSNTTYVFFRCPSSTSSSSHIMRQKGFRDENLISSLGSHDFQVYAYSTFFQPTTYEKPIVSCTKAFSISINPRELLFPEYQWQLSWSTPNCGKCEAKGEYCKLADHNTTTTTTCFPIPKQSPTTVSGTPSSFLFFPSQKQTK